MKRWSPAHGEPMQSSEAGSYVGYADHVRAINAVVLERDEAIRNIDGLTAALRSQIKRADRHQTENARLRLEADEQQNIAMQTMARVAKERDEARAERDAAYAEIERLTNKLHELGKLPPSVRTVTVGNAVAVGGGGGAAQQGSGPITGSGAPSVGFHNFGTHMRPVTPVLPTGYRVELGTMLQSQEIEQPDCVVIVIRHKMDSGLGTLPAIKEQN